MILIFLCQSIKNPTNLWKNITEENRFGMQMNYEFSSLMKNSWGEQNSSVTSYVTLLKKKNKVYMDIKSLRKPIKLAEN